ncbi:MAG: YdcH family protein [Beijerinckiaceae bacterium]
MNLPDNDDSADAPLLAELERLRQEHRDLDVAIDALAASPLADQLQIQRLKKRKLVLRDKIAKVEDLLTPDIIA